MKFHKMAINIAAVSFVFALASIFHPMPACAGSSSAAVVSQPAPAAASAPDSPDACDICADVLKYDFEFPIHRAGIIESRAKEFAELTESGEKKDVRSLYGLGTYYYLSGEPGRAAQYFDAASRSGGGHIEKAALGLSLLDNCEYDSAAVRLREALALKPDYDPAAALLTEAVYRSGSFENAVSFARSELSKRESPALRVTLGKIFDERGDFASAIAEFEKAAKADPGSKFPLFYSALMYLALDDTLSADSTAKKLEKMDEATGKFLDQLVSFTSLGKDNAERTATFRTMGHNCFAQGDFLVACMPYSAALRFEPNDFESRRGLGASLLRIGDYRRALASLEAAVALNPKSAAAVYDLALLSGKIGKTQRSIELLNRTIDLDPKNSGSYYNLGVIYDDARDYEKAIKAFQKAIEIDRDYELAHFNLGITYGNYMGDYEKAVAPLERAVKIKPDWDEAQFNLAIAYAKTEKHKKAVECYEKAEKLKYSDTENLNLLKGISLIRLKKNPEAKEAFGRVLKENPANDAARFNLGALQFYCGDKKAAKRKYEELQKRNSPYAKDLLKIIEKK